MLEIKFNYGNCDSPRKFGTTFNKHPVLYWFLMKSSEKSYFKYYFVKYV